MGCGASVPNISLDTPDHLDVLFRLKNTVNDSRNSDLYRAVPGASVVLEDTLTELLVQLVWNDQGWGNSKGQCLLKLVSREGKVLAEEKIGLAPHVRQRQPFSFGSDANICKLSHQGANLSISYLVGGGGGHALCIQQLEVAGAYRKSEDLATVSAGNNAMGTTNTNAVFVNVD